MRLNTAITLLARTRLITWILFAFVTIGVIYSVTVPSWEAPDEFDHFLYALFIRTQHALPVQSADNVATSHHPPLYYLLAAAISLPVDAHDTTGTFHGNPGFLFGTHGGHDLNLHQLSTADTFPYTGMALALHLMRWLSLVFGAGTVWLTYKLAQELLPERENVAWFATALVAFNPQFLFISASALNDTLVVLAATGLFLQLARSMQQPCRWQHWFGVGLWLSTAAMSKISGVALIPIAGLAVLISAYRHRSIKLLAQAGLAVAIPVTILTGWWFIRIWLLYADVLGMTAWLHHFRGAIRTQPIDWGQTFLQQLRSAWGIFGWMTVAAPEWFHYSIWMLLGLAAVGLVFYALKQFNRNAPGGSFEAWRMLGCASLVLYQQGLMIRENLLWITASQGRYLFPVIAPAMILVSLGLVTLIPRQFTKIMLGTISLALLGGSIFMPLAVIGPNYHMRYTLPKSHLWSVHHEIVVTTSVVRAKQRPKPVL